MLKNLFLITLIATQINFQAHNEAKLPEKIALKTKDENSCVEKNHQKSSIISNLAPVGAIVAVCLAWSLGFYMGISIGKMPKACEHKSIFKGCGNITEDDGSATSMISFEMIPGQNPSDLKLGKDQMKNVTFLDNPHTNKEIQEAIDKHILETRLQFPTPNGKWVAAYIVPAGDILP